MKRSIALIAFLIATSIHQPATASEVDDHLAVLQHLVGKTWTGKLDEIELTKRIEPILGAMALRERTEAPALDYSDETIFYWDPEKEEIALFKVTSRGHVIRGTVRVESGLVVLEGEAVRPDGTARYRRTFDLKADGTLVDLYYNLEGQEWIEAHHIEYTGSADD